jgi:TP901 family phage tail tape measure protein
MSSAMLAVSVASSTAGAVLVTAARSGRASLQAARTASLGLVAAFGLAAYAAANFDRAMSGVKAVTFASARDLAALRQAAIDAGQATQYSATEAATAEAELAKAGVSVKDILGGGLKGTLALAAAGQLDLADAAVVSAKAMNAFGLAGNQVGHVADVLAAGAGKSATDVHELGMALTQSALLAHQTGLSLEDTAGALALFAQNGMAGQDSGTSLKNMLMRLTPQSAEAAGMMEKLGFSAYDSAGNFVGLAETAGRMQQAFGNLTPEMRNAAFGVIFGSDATRAATVLYGAGAQGVSTWTKAVADQGYATRVAATQTDNLAGDLERLKGALETALIQSGTAANGALRDMAQALSSVVNWYSRLPPGVQQSVTVMGGMVGVLGLVASGLLLMLPRVMTVRRELATLGLTAGRTRGLMMGLGRLGVVVGMLGAVSYMTSKITQAMDEAPPSVSKLTNSLITLATTGKASGEVADKLGDDLDGFGDAVKRIAHPGALNSTIDTFGKIPLLGQKDASLDKATKKLKAVDEALAQLVSNGNAGLAEQAFKKLAKAAEENGTGTEKLKTLLPQYGEALTNTDTQQKLAVDSAKAMGDQAAKTADDLQDTRTEAEKLTDALNALNGVNITSAQSAISYRQSLDDLRQTVKETGLSTDITTEKGRKVKGAFLDAADAAMKHAQAVTEQKGSVEAGNKVLLADIEILRQQMLQMGFSKKTVDQLLGSYARIPKSVATDMIVRDRASKEIAGIRDKLAKTTGKSVTVKALTAGAEKTLNDLGFKVTHLKGGQVRVAVPTAGPHAAISKIQHYLDGLHANVIVTTTVKGGGSVAHEGGGYSYGGIVHRAAEGMVVPGYAPRRDTVRALLSPGEGVLVPETVRALGGAKGIGALNRWGRYGSGLRFAGGGVVPGVQRFAEGGIPSYSPQAAPVLGGPGDAMDRYKQAVQQLKDAWAALADAMKNQTAQIKQLSGAETRQRQTRADGARRVSQAEDNLERVRKGHHTAKQLAAAEDRLANARAAAEKANKAAAARTAKERGDVAAAAAGVSKAKGAVGAADAALGLHYGAKAPSGFDLTGYQKQLGKSVAETEAWRKSLSAIGARGGSEIRTILEGMGEDGYALVQALAKAGDKQFADIVSKLKATAGQAKASLADFQNQISGATKESAQFASDLQKLAASGYGDLAQALAAQGDQAAQDLAHQAAGDSKAAGAANAAVKGAGGVLTGQDLANSLVLLTTLRAKPGQGLAALAAAGLDPGTVKALAPKVMKQIKALPAQYRTELLAELAGQGGVTAMARGGLLTRPTAVLAAEAGVPEWFIPQNSSTRSAGLLAGAAAAMGYQLVPAGRWAGSGAPGQVHQDYSRTQHLHLHGADRSLGEQRADLLRHMHAMA